MYPHAKITKDTYISRVSWATPNPLSGKDRLVVNTSFTQILLIINIQILLIINRSQLPFTLSKLSTKGQPYAAQMCILLMTS